MKSMKHLRMPVVNTNMVMGSNSIQKCEKAAAEILVAASNNLEDPQSFNRIKKKYDLKRTDGHGVISISNIHRNVCRQLVFNTNDRMRMAQFLIDRNFEAEDIIGIQVNHLFQALRLVLMDPKLAALVHEAAKMMFEKGQVGEFMLNYNADPNAAKDQPAAAARVR